MFNDPGFTAALRGSEAGFKDPCEWKEKYLVVIRVVILLYEVYMSTVLFLILCSSGLGCEIVRV